MYNTIGAYLGESQNSTLYFGSINPTVTGNEVDNDSYIVTSNGLSSGTPVSFWKFDAETLLWVQVPSGGSTVTVVDNIDGTVTINAGGVNVQNAQRPILELPILARNLVDPSADYDDIWDASAGRMVRVLATRASLLTYKADGLNDTRAGDIGSTGSSIFAVHDHIHPILAIATPPATPVLVASGSGLSISQQILTTVVLTEEESITFNFRVLCLQTISNAWNILTVPNIAGFKTPITTVGGTYRSVGNPNAAAGWHNSPSMMIEASNYNMTNQIYLNCQNRTQGVTIEVFLSIKYILA